MENKNNKKMLLWGIGTAGEGFVSIISSTYLSYFLTDVLKLPLSVSGPVLIVTSVGSFAIASFIGVFIAAVKPMRWGRLRSWLLVAPPIGAVFFVLHFTRLSNNPIVCGILIVLCYIVAITAFNLAYTANISLTNIIANNQEERNRFNSQRMIGSNVGRLSGNYLVPVLVTAFAATMPERISYPLLIGIAGLFFIAFELIQFSLAKGKEDEYFKSNNITDSSLKFKDMFSILKSNGQLLVTLLIDLTSNVASIALPSLAVYYYKYVAEKREMVSTHMLCIGLAGLCGALIVRLFGKKVKSFKKCLLVVYLIISALLASTKLVQGNATAFLCMNIGIHLLTGTTTPFEMNLYQDNVIYSEWKTGVNANALIMGLSEIPVKVAGVLKSVLLTVALATAGYDPISGVAPTASVKNAIANAYAFIPAIIPLIGFILLLSAYKLTPEKVANMKKEIKQRNNNPL